jgi:glucokinase
MSQLYLGIEIGATKHQIALGNAEGELLEVRRGRVDLDRGAEGILSWMKENVGELIARESQFQGKVLRIAVGFGGIIESATGRIVTSVQVSGWQDFMLKSWFESCFGLPTVVLNDTVAGGYGEYAIGSGRGSKCFFYTNIGSGIGGAIIIGGKCYDGQGYGAAYFGHTYLPDWTVDLPGSRQKVEELCSGWAIERRLRSQGYVPTESLLMKSCEGERKLITCTMLDQAARDGDVFALLEIDRIARSLGTGLSNVITLFSPDCVSIGGGVSNMGDLLLDPLRRYVEEGVFLSARGRYRIVRCAFGDEAVLVGAIVYGARQLIL